jgi:hypothetical protein
VHVEYNNSILNNTKLVNNVVTVVIDDQLYYINGNGYNITMELYKLYRYIIGVKLDIDNDNSNNSIDSNNRPDSNNNKMKDLSIDKRISIYRNTNDLLTCSMLQSAIGYIGTHIYLSIGLSIYLSILLSIDQTIYVSTYL